jgi:hypothetical protein
MVPILVRQVNSGAGCPIDAGTPYSTVSARLPLYPVCSPVRQNASFAAATSAHELDISLTAAVALDHYETL